MTHRVERLILIRSSTTLQPPHEQLNGMLHYQYKRHYAPFFCWYHFFPQLLFPFLSFLSDASGSFSLISSYILLLSLLLFLFLVA